MGTINYRSAVGTRRQASFLPQARDRSAPGKATPLHKGSDDSQALGRKVLDCHWIKEGA
jgi:hypothetical protein